MLFLFEHPGRILFVNHDTGERVTRKLFEVPRRIAFVDGESVTRVESRAISDGREMLSYSPEGKLLARSIL